MESVKKKILIFSPIGDFGGRELEAGFIAGILSKENIVDICTSGVLTEKSQIFDFDKNQNVFSVNDLLTKKYLFIRLLSYLSFLKNNFKGAVSNYTNNGFAKKYFGYNKKREAIIEDLVSGYDLIFICADLSSLLMSEVVGFAKRNNIKVLFRTTGAIRSTDYDYLNDVDCYIHHSHSNVNKLSGIKKQKFEIIDQCAFNENVLLEIPLVKKEVKFFLTLGRLVRDKNIDVVIRAFKKAKSVGDKLYVVGDGEDLERLIKIAGDDEDIIFTGFISNRDLAHFLSLVDCVIVTYHESEAGPLTGIEAMAASRLLISAKTGAMEERLPFNKYWFDNYVNELSNQIKEIKKLSANDVLELSQKIRARYTEEYSEKCISEKYSNVVNKFFR